VNSSLTAHDIFVKVLRYTAVLALVIAVVGGTVGFLVVGVDGLWSALIATAVAVVFSAITAASMILAIRFDLMAFFGIVMGAWLLKLVIFIVALFLLRDQPFLHPIVFYITLIASILGTFAIDAVVVLGSRVGYVSDSVLPTRPSGDDV
jgi:hypothetical protein